MAPLQRLTDKELKGLVAWYRKNQRAFPWRAEPRPYWVWLAEIMSQQTQMATLVPYFHRFLERFPTIEALARAGEEDVLAAWTGLGYYSRARNVHKAAKKIVFELGGRFPESFEGWLEMPGVGPYTAAAIASQCFGVREPVWDGNVIRVCSRLETRADALSAAFREEVKQALRAKMKGHDASEFNQALMELGATVCTPKSPACGRCPISAACGALARDAVAAFPPPKPRKAQRELECRVVVRLRKAKGGAVEAFLRPRPESHWFSGMWDFPSELGGSDEPLVRDVALELEGAVEIGDVRHQITHHKITLKGLLRKERSTAAGTGGRWIALDSLVADETPVPISTTARKMLKLLFQKQLATL